MPTFQTEIVKPLSAIPTAPHVGNELKPPTDLSQAMLDYSVTPVNQQIISHLLGEVGVEVDWQTGTGKVTPKTPDGVQMLLNRQLEHYQQRASEVYDLANEKLPEFKQELVEGLAQYGQRLGIEDRDLERILGSRIAGVHEVRIIAPLAKASSFEYITRNPSHMATMEKKSGVLAVDVETLLEEEATSGKDKSIILKKLVLHELEHAVSVLSLTEDGSWMVVSGLGSFPAREDEEGIRDWTGNFLLEEGAQEHIRWKELDGEPPEYEQGVMLWEMLIDIDPEIEKLRFEAKFLGRNRGELIGRIENILGPTAIEELEAFCDVDGNQRLISYPAFKDKIVSMISIDGDEELKDAEQTKNVQMRARKVLDETQLRVFKHKGWDYTDEQLLLAKQNGAVAAKDIATVLATI